MSEDEVIVDGEFLLEKPKVKAKVESPILETIYYESDELGNLIPKEETQQPKSRERIEIEPQETKKDIIDRLKRDLQSGKLTGTHAFGVEELIRSENKRKEAIAAPLEKPKKEQNKDRSKLEADAKRYDIPIQREAQREKAFIEELIDSVKETVKADEDKVKAKEEDKNKKLPSNTPVGNEDSKQNIIGHEAQYRLLDKLGEGGFGKVYSAEEVVTGIKKAVKIFNPDKARKINVKKLEERVKEINKRTGDEIVKVEHVYEGDASNGEKTIYMIMPLIDSTFIKAVENKSLKQRLDVFYNTLDKVKQLHDNGIVHKDLKPSNILADKYGNVKLSDTDLVQILEQGTGVELSDILASATLDRQVVSFRYSAPELLRKEEKIDRRADVYSLGVILYELIVGEGFEHDWREEMEIRNYSPEVIKIISRAIRKNAKDRYQSVEEMKNDLEKLDLEKIIIDKTKKELVEKQEKVVDEKAALIETLLEEQSKEEKKDEKIKYTISSKSAGRRLGFYQFDDVKEVLIKTASVADKINNILVQENDKLRLKSFNLQLQHKAFDHYKDCRDVSSIEEALKAKYKIPEYLEFSDYQNYFVFESDKLRLVIDYVKQNGQRWDFKLRVTPEIKVPFEGNEQLYNKLKNYFDKELKSWWFHKRHFRRLAEQGYTYETARKLFTDGTFDQFGKKQEKSEVVKLEVNYDKKYSALTNPDYGCFEKKAFRRNDGSVEYLSYDKSLESIKKRGGLRHLRPHEAFGLITDGLEGKLSGTDKETFEEMHRNYEWLSSAFETNDDKLICYLDPEGLEYHNGDYMKNSFKFAEKKEFNIKGIPKNTWVELEKMPEDFVVYFYGKKFKDLPKKIQESQIYLPPNKKWWPVGRGYYGINFNVNAYYYFYNRASRGVAVVGAPKNSSGSGGKNILNAKLEEFEIKTSTKLPNQITNDIEVQEGDKTFIYRGIINHPRLDEDKIRGYVHLFKIEKRKVKKKKFVKFFPIPQRKEVEIEKQIEEWDISADDYSTDVNSAGKIVNDYKTKIYERAVQEKGIKLSDKLFKSVFDPLDKKIADLYEEIKEYKPAN